MHHNILLLLSWFFFSFNSKRGISEKIDSSVLGNFIPVVTFCNLSFNKICSPKLQDNYKLNILWCDLFLTLFFFLMKGHSYNVCMVVKIHLFHMKFAELFYFTNNNKKTNGNSAFNILMFTVNNFSGKWYCGGSFWENHFLLVRSMLPVKYHRDNAWLVLWHVTTWNLTGEVLWKCEKVSNLAIIILSKN